MYAQYQSQRRMMGGINLYVETLIMNYAEGRGLTLCNKPADGKLAQ
jgi:hypothetical protein